MYQAFPHQKFGAATGRVESIARTILTPAEIAASGFSVAEPMFRVAVSLPSETVAAYGRREVLAPGMMLTADVIIDRRNLLEWLFDPLLAAARR